jgi:Fis family transcriptional regulator
MVMTEVEGPMLEEVLKHCKGNQSEACKILGINRGTLRTKLKNHKLI